MPYSQILHKLARDLELIISNDFDPSFTVRKITALAEDNIEAYCETLEEELEIKSQRLTELLRAGELSTEIVERLRARVTADTAEMEALREKQATAERQLDACTGLLADSGHDRASLEHLVANLETENRREAARCSALEATRRETQKNLLEQVEATRRYKTRFQHAAHAAEEAQEAAHQATKRAEAAEEQLSTLRRATWSS